MSKKKAVTVSIAFPDIGLKIDKVKLINQDNQKQSSFLFLTGLKDVPNSTRVIYANVEAFDELDETPLVIKLVREEGELKGLQFKDWFVPIGICTLVHVNKMALDIEEYQPNMYRMIWSSALLEDMQQVNEIIITKE